VNLFPLQLPQFYKETKPLDVLWFILGVGIVITALILINRSKKKLGINNSSINNSGVSIPRPHWGKSFAIHKFSRSAGLNSSQAKMLSFVLKNGKAADPKQVLQSPALLDQNFKKAYQSIGQAAKPDDETQQELSVFFATRNILETIGGEGTDINSTRVIPDNTPAVLVLEEENYSVQVISSRGAYLLVEHPLNSMGELISVKPGTEVTLFFYVKSSNGFSFVSRVNGAVKASAGKQALQIVHSNDIKRLSQRRFRRRQTVLPVEFSLVRPKPGQRKGKQKQTLIVEKRKAAGKILDISVGGCSIQTSGSVSAGVKLKIDFTTADKQHAAVLGEVLRINRDRTGTVMHVKFLKIPRRSLNVINAFVFEYLDT
jgi:c-di-GMP-binding flagellar brake protein YcgR